MEKTDWFPGGVKPVRSGVYERMASVGKAIVIRYAHYDTVTGEWGLSGSTPDDAMALRWDTSPAQMRFWRGVKGPT